jgi:hypothetical protein
MVVRETERTQENSPNQLIGFFGCAGSGAQSCKVGADGYSAARIEEEVTDRGCKVITRFPAEDLPIANAY